MPIASTIQSGAGGGLIRTIKNIDIFVQKVSPSSPMPLGLLNTLSKDEIFDLLAFLERRHRTNPALELRAAVGHTGRPMAHNGNRPGAKPARRKKAR